MQFAPGRRHAKASKASIRGESCKARPGYYVPALENAKGQEGRSPLNCGEHNVMAKTAMESRTSKA